MLWQVSGRSPQRCHPEPAGRYLPDPRRPLHLARNTAVVRVPGRLQRAAWSGRPDRRSALLQLREALTERSRGRDRSPGVRHGLHRRDRDGRRHLLRARGLGWILELRV